MVFWSMSGLHGREQEKGGKEQQGGKQNNAQSSSPGINIYLTYLAHVRDTDLTSVAIYFELWNFAALTH